MISGQEARGQGGFLHCRYNVYGRLSPLEQHAEHRTLYFRRVDSTLLRYFDMHGILLVFLLYHICSSWAHNYQIRYSTEDKRRFNHIFHM